MAQSGPSLTLLGTRTVGAAVHTFHDQSSLTTATALKETLPAAATCCIEIDPSRFFRGKGVVL